MEPAFETVKVLITGKVQGVSYRHSTVRMAHQLKLRGWVQNLQDGCVEAVLQGGQPNQVATTLLVKNGGELAVRIGLAGVIRDLVPDGLVAAVTLDSSQA